jgi:hypothetical protein
MDGDRYLDRSGLAVFLGGSARNIDRRVAEGSLPPSVRPESI